MIIMFKPVVDREINGGTQQIYRFDNGYGASVIDSPISYGTEMAVIKFRSNDNTDFVIVYDTPITHDVLGHLTFRDVEGYLNDVSLLSE